MIKERSWRFNVTMCFLIFVAIAGVFGAATVSLMIMVVQTVPAVAAMVLAYLAYRKAANRQCNIRHYSRRTLNCYSS